jgi:hypothetical protein
MLQTTSMDSAFTLELSGKEQPEIPHMPPSLDAIESKKRQNHSSTTTIVDATILNQRRIQRPLSTYTSLGEVV